MAVHSIIPFDVLPAESWVKARDICRTRSGPGVVPFGKTKWLAMVKAGGAPKPKYFGAQPLWNVGEIRTYLRDLSKQAPTQSTRRDLLVA